MPTTSRSPESPQACGGCSRALVAVWAAELGSLIEVVNRIGSFFYGSVLGVFILAIAFPRATGTGAFVGLIAGMSAVALVAAFTPVAFLWHNVIGAVVVVFVGLGVSLCHALDDVTNTASRRSRSTVRCDTAYRRLEPQRVRSMPCACPSDRRRSER